MRGCRKWGLFPGGNHRVYFFVVVGSLLEGYAVVYWKEERDEILSLRSCISLDKNVKKISVVGGCLVAPFVPCFG